MEELDGIRSGDDLASDDGAGTNTAAEASSGKLWNAVHHNLMIQMIFDRQAQSWTKKHSGWGPLVSEFVEITKITRTVSAFHKQWVNFQGKAKQVMTLNST